MVEGPTGGKKTSNKELRVNDNVVVGEIRKMEDGYDISKEELITF